MKVDSLPSDHYINQLLKNLRQINRPTDIDIIETLEEKGSLTVSELAEEVGKEKGTVSDRTQKLEEIGVVKREKDSGKFGRSTIILEQGG